MLETHSKHCNCNYVKIHAPISCIARRANKFMLTYTAYGHLLWPPSATDFLQAWQVPSLADSLESLGYWFPHSL